MSYLVVREESEAMMGYVTGRPAEGAQSIMHIFRLFAISLSAFLLLLVDARAQSIPLSANENPTVAAANCANAGYTLSMDTFAGCWVSQMATDQQKEVANCIINSPSWPIAGFCMAGRNLSPSGRVVASCALQAAAAGQGSYQGIAGCAGFMGFDPRAVRLAGCVAANPTDFWGAAMCAGGQQLTPEQRVFAECAVETGLQPYAFAACAGGQLTLNEFQKCFEIGIGGDGCFGDNNTIVRILTSWTGGNNSVINRPGQIFGGSHSVFNDPAQIWGGPNSIFNTPSQIWGGPNSVVRNPGQIWGEPNSVVNKPSQLWGGSNSVVRNPDQLLGGDNSFFHKNLGIHL
jgi:hypothetical protein